MYCKWVSSYVVWSVLTSRKYTGLKHYFLQRFKLVDSHQLTGCFRYCSTKFWRWVEILHKNSGEIVCCCSCLWQCLFKQRATGYLVSFKCLGAHLSSAPLPIQCLISVYLSAYLSRAPLHCLFQCLFKQRDTAVLIIAYVWDFCTGTWIWVLWTLNLSTLSIPSVISGLGFTIEPESYS